MPAEPAGTFEPHIVSKHRRRLSALSGLEEVYDTTISRDLVSTLTEKVTKEMREWQAQPSRRPLTQKFRQPDQRVPGGVGGDHRAPVSQDRVRLMP